MPPNSTQNLNAKLTGLSTERRRAEGTGTDLPKPAIRGSASTVRIVGAATTYRGGYHLSL